MKRYGELLLFSTGLQAWGNEKRRIVHICINTAPFFIFCFRACQYVPPFNNRSGTPLFLLPEDHSALPEKPSGTDAPSFVPATAQYPSNFVILLSRKHAYLHLLRTVVFGF